MWLHRSRKKRGMLWRYFCCASPVHYSLFWVWGYQVFLIRLLARRLVGELLNLSYLLLIKCEQKNCDIFCYLALVVTFSIFGGFYWDIDFKKLIIFKNLFFWKFCFKMFLNFFCEQGWLCYKFALVFSQVLADFQHIQHECLNLCARKLFALFCDRIGGD